MQVIRSIPVVKTTIQPDDELWKAFSKKVIDEYGGRSKNDVIVELMKLYVNGKVKVQL